MVEDESGSVVAEATPDCYVRKVSLVIYIIIGKTESVDSKHPEVQLTIGALGSLLKLEKKKNRSSSFP